MPKDSRLRVPGLPGGSFTRGLAVVALALLTTAAAQAAWLPSGTPFAVAPGNPAGLRAVTDGRGGFIAAWIDTTGGVARILAQRVDSTGTSQWTAGGVTVTTNADSLKQLVAAPDGQNGALLAWVARRAPARYKVYVQRLNAGGLAQWTANGLRADTVAVDTLQGFPAIDSDGAGGAIVAWSENRGNTDYDVYAQRILADSSRAWTVGGVNVDDPDTDPQARPQVLGDGTGGAWLSWIDVEANPQTFFQHLDPAGAVVSGWTAGGVSSTSSTSLNAVMTRLPGSSNLMVAWSDPGPSRLEGSLLLANGTFQDPSGNLLASTASSPTALVDVGGGATVLIAQEGASSIRAVAVTAQGAAGVASIIASGQGLDANSNLQAVSDGANGVYVVWANGDYLQVHHLSSAIAPLPGFVAPATRGGSNTHQRPVAVGGFDLLISWVDTRDPGANAQDLYATRVSFTGVAAPYWRVFRTTGAGTGTFTPSVARTWVPQGDSLRITFVGSGGNRVDHLIVGATNFGPVPGYTFHNVTGDSTLQAFFSTTAATLDVAAPANKYRAFSLPFALGDATVGSAFANLMPYDNTRWRLGHWVGSDSAYAEPSGTLTQIVPGEGYWFRGLKDTTLSFSGTPVAEAQFNITMLGKTGGQGWTQFGSPFRFPVAVSQLRLSPIPNVPITDGTNTFTDHEVLVWTPADSAYHPAAILLPGEVYWLHRNSATATTLRIPFDWFPVAAGPVPALAQQADWSVGVDLRSGGARAHVDLGAAAVPADRWNGLSTHALSGPDQPLVLEAVVGDWGADNGVYRSVFRPDAEALVYEFEASAPAGLASATLAFAFDRLPADRHVTLVNPAAGWSREVSADAPVPVVLSANARRFRLEVTSGAPVPGRTPLATALRALGPNPFRDATTVSFALAHSGALKWEVFDITGRRVSAETRQLAAGEHAITWDGRDAAGARVRPGLYLIRWQADGRSGSARVVRTE